MPAARSLRVLGRHRGMTAHATERNVAPRALADAESAGRSTILLYDSAGLIHARAEPWGDEARPRRPIRLKILTPPQINHYSPGQGYGGRR